MHFSTICLIAAAHHALALPGSSTKTVSCSEIYQCSTATVTAMQTASGCPSLTKCPPVPQCILKATKTIYNLPLNPCCAPASTLTVMSACPSCQSGCSTSTELAYYNTPPTPIYAKPTTYTPPLNTGPAPTQQPVFKMLPGPALAGSDSDCPRTVYVDKSWEMGPTKTEYMRYETETVSRDCGGCSELVTRGWRGKGPVVRYEGTVTESFGVETRTSWVCMSTEGVEQYF